MKKFAKAAFYRKSHRAGLSDNSRTNDNLGISAAGSGKWLWQVRISGIAGQDEMRMKC